MKLEKAIEIVRAIAEAGNAKYDELSRRDQPIIGENAKQELAITYAAQKLIELRVDNLGILEELVEFIEGDIPSKDCHCHNSPPCNDCMDFGGIRETIEAAKSKHEA